MGFLEKLPQIKITPFLLSDFKGKLKTGLTVLFILTLLLLTVKILIQPSETQATGACVNPPSGLVSWWSGDGHTFNQISDTNHGTMPGVQFPEFATERYDTGKYGQAFKFDGTADSKVEVPHNDNLNISSSFTVEGWIYPTFIPDRLRIRVGKGGGTNLWKMFLLHNPTLNQNRALVVIINDNILTTPNDVVTLDSWNHVALTLDQQARKLTIYINGAEKATKSLPASITTTNNFPFSMGGSGRIDELSIYGRALSTAEIQSIFNAQSRGKCKKTPVIIVPGITASKLWDFTDQNNPREVWPSLSETYLEPDDHHIQKLAFQADGTTPVTDGENIKNWDEEELRKPGRADNEGAGKDNDVIRTEEITGIPDVERVLMDTLSPGARKVEYLGKFIKFLEDQEGFKERRELFVFAYDWRKSMRGPTGTALGKLGPKIDKIIAKTGLSKVDIIAQSQGNNVTDYYAKKAPANAAKINKYLSLVAPHTGATEMFLVMTKGLFLNETQLPGWRGFTFLNQNVIKELVANMPAAYQLLPNKYFFDTLKGPDPTKPYNYIFVDDCLFQVKCPKYPRTPEATYNYSNDDWKPPETHLPLKNQNLVAEAKKYWEDMAAWDKRVNVDVETYLIVGSKRETEFKTIRDEFNKKLGVRGINWFIEWNNGDGTVPDFSQEGLTSTKSGFPKKYYFNQLHSDIFKEKNPEGQPTGVREVIGKILKNQAPPESDFPKQTIGKKLKIEILDPGMIDVEIKDPNQRITGTIPLVDPDTGQTLATLLRREIPHSTYFTNSEASVVIEETEVRENSYEVLVPCGESFLYSYQAQISARETSDVLLTIDEFDQNGILNRVYYPLINLAAGQSVTTTLDCTQGVLIPGQLVMPDKSTANPLETGRLQGNVTETNGTPIKGVTISAVGNIANFDSRGFDLTNGTGDYQLLPLVAGEYQVTTRAGAVEKSEVITINTGPPTTLDFVLDFANPDDFDEDQMPNSFEYANTCLDPFVNDANLDYDADSFSIGSSVNIHLKNIDEFGIGTNPCSADTDGDLFNDGLEIYITTDPLDACPNNLAHAAWPLDFDNNGAVTIADIFAVASKFGTTEPRYDLNGNGGVDINDTFIVSQNFGKICSN